MVKKRLSISNKLIFMIVSSTLITLIMAVATILYFNIQTIKTRAVENISVLGDVIAERSTAALAFMDSNQAEVNLKALQNMQYVEMGCLYDFEFKIAAIYIENPRKQSHPLVCPEQIMGDLSQGVYEDDHLLWGREILLEDSVIGFIYIVTNNSFVFDEFYQGIIQYLLIIVITLLLSFIIAKYIQGFFSEPILRLQYTAQKIATDKDFSIRAIKTSDDELGDLVDAFNRMLLHTEEYEKTLLIQKQQLQSHREILESTVKRRTQKLQELNNQLTQTLTHMENMQGQLIESEKMASLGGLVAGVAHEVNTPIGVCLTASSYLQKSFHGLSDKYLQENMSKEDFEEFLQTVGDSSNMIMANIQRAAETIRNFKKVAVDQSNEASRCFNVRNYLDEIIKSLHPKLKHHQHEIEIHATEQLMINSYPGSFYQIFSNLILNSYIHAFDDNKQGNIIIDIQVKDDYLFIEYQDNGNGIPEAIVNKVFEPFITSKRNQGGSGLGAHIIYNIITQQLHGKISCKSQLGLGVLFKMEIPIQLCPSHD